MDKKSLYEKVEKAFNQAFEAAKQSMKVVSEKAGEAASVTKLHLEKAALEHRVSKKFAQLGNAVYEKAVRHGENSLDLTEGEFEKLIKETQDLDQDLARLEAEIEKEQTAKDKAAQSGE